MRKRKARGSGAPCELRRELNRRATRFREKDMGSCGISDPCGLQHGHQSMDRSKHPPQNPPCCGAPICVLCFFRCEHTIQHTLGKRTSHSNSDQVRASRHFFMRKLLKQSSKGVIFPVKCVKESDHFSACFVRKLMCDCTGRQTCARLAALPSKHPSRLRVGIACFACGCLDTEQVFS